MKVSEMPYEHIPLEEFQKSALEIIEGVKNAKSSDEILEWRKKYLELAARYSTAMNLSYIRYSCNTADEFYVKENDYFDEEWIDKENEYISKLVESMTADFGYAIGD